MMQGRSIEYAVAEKALGLGLPFALYLFPGDEHLHFIAENPARQSSGPVDLSRFSGFLYSQFDIQPEIAFKGIRPDWDAETVIALDIAGHSPSAGPQLQLKSTDYDAYCKSVERVVEALAGSDDEKVVISRIEAIISDRSPARIAELYFRVHPACFRYLYFTPECGVWLGASPELAADMDLGAGILRTMSLAGTRHSGSTASWDRKNRLEHDIVTRHLVKALESAGLSVAPPRGSEVTFGEVTHLCHQIEARGRIEAAPLLGSMFPSPALLGYPREKAFSLIAGNEAHSRLCYGGLVGVADSGGDSPRLSLYVNLRCCAACRLDCSPAFLYNLYGGGGITSRSNPADEWEETVRKLRSLRLILVAADSASEKIKNSFS